ncbi:hypothetical protein [Bacillus sp. S3]|nr:hypothetical protein [Bacillus sp. S3]
MKKAAILLFSITLLVFSSPVTGTSSAKTSVNIADAASTTDHPILPPV